MKRLRIACCPPRSDNDEWFLIPTIRLTTGGMWTDNKDGVFIVQSIVSI